VSFLAPFPTGGDPIDEIHKDLEEMEPSGNFLLACDIKEAISNDVKNAAEELAD
jgi:hypothetical protein